MLNIDELSIVRLYSGISTPNRNRTVNKMKDAIPFMDDDIRLIAESAVAKITAMSESEFSLLDFEDALLATI